MESFNSVRFVDFKAPKDIRSETEINKRTYLNYEYKWEIGFVAIEEARAE